jgi:hypothetical protein
MTIQQQIASELRAKADEFEIIGVEQYRRSCDGPRSPTDVTFSDFNNALMWGRRAREFRRAALIVERMS